MNAINFNIIALATLLVSSFAISAILKRNLATFAYVTGIEFLATGILLAETYGVGLMDKATLDTFTPVISLVVGLFGFLIGLEVKAVSLNDKAAATGFSISFWLALLSAAVMFVLAVVLLPGLELASSVLLSPIGTGFISSSFFLSISDNHLWLALTCGAMAIVSSYITTKTTISVTGSQGPLSAMLPRLAAPGEILGIIIFGSTIAAARAIESSATLGWTITEWTVAAIAMGVFSGLLFWLFVGEKTSAVKTYLATIGVVALVTGFATTVGISPLFLNFICGATMALTAPAATDAMSASLGQLRGPLSIMAIFFAGSLLGAVQPEYIIIAVCFIAVRWVFLSGIASLLFDRLGLERHVSNPARSLYYQDMVVVVIGLDLALRKMAISQAALYICTISYIFYRIWGHRQLRRFLQDAGEFRFSAVSSDRKS